jgi:cell division protein FtsB
MHVAQLERLKKDSKNLEHYIHKLNKKGRNDLAYKLARKQEFLNQHILELQQK